MYIFILEEKGNEKNFNALDNDWSFGTFYRLWKRRKVRFAGKNSKHNSYCRIVCNHNNKWEYDCQFDDIDRTGDDRESRYNFCNVQNRHKYFSNNYYNNHNNYNYNVGYYYDRYYGNHDHGYNYEFNRLYDYRFITRRRDRGDS